MFIKELEYMEEVNSKVSDIHDLVEQEFREMLNDNTFKFPREHSDIVWTALQEVLEHYSETGDYKNYN